MQSSNPSVKYRALDVKTPWPKAPKTFNWRLIPKRLEQLAKDGVYYESRVITKK